MVGLDLDEIIDAVFSSGVSDNVGCSAGCRFEMSSAAPTSNADDAIDAAVLLGIYQ